MKKEKGLSKNYQAFEAIKNLILNGELFPGQKITYRDLEKRLKMSKTPIINALMMLEQESLVLSERNRGFYVRVAKRKEAEQIYEVRQGLESIAIEAAIKQCDAAGLNELKRRMEAYNHYESPLYDQKRWALDCAFHLQIAAMGKNPFFTKIIEQVYNNIYFTLQVVFLNPSIDRFRSDHKLLFEAIRNRRLEEAKKIAKKHTDVAINLLVSVIKHN